MPRPFLLALLGLVLLSRMALGDYQTGVRAWARGDYAAAAAAFQSAAEAGEPESQYMMGRLYSLGDGVPQDFVQAWLWFDRAARHGHAAAAEARDGLDHVLNAGQLALAHQLAMPPPSPVLPPPSSEVAAAPADAGRPVVLVPRRGTVEAPSPDEQSGPR